MLVAININGAFAERSMVVRKRRNRHLRANEDVPILKKFDPRIPLSFSDNVVT